MKAFAATVASLLPPPSGEDNSSLPLPLAGEGRGEGPRPTPTYRHFRPGDMCHSLADTNKANILLGYLPTHRIADGIKTATRWYVGNIELFK